MGSEMCIRDSDSEGQEETARTRRAGFASTSDSAAPLAVISNLEPLGPSRCKGVHLLMLASSCHRSLVTSTFCLAGQERPPT